jgi:hypothetical protein
MPGLLTYSFSFLRQIFDNITDRLHLSVTVVILALAITAVILYRFIPPM